MIKVEVIENFTLKDFNKLKNIERKNLNEPGKLYIGDRFECDKIMADYLLGENKDKKTVVKVLEIVPLKTEAEPIKEEPEIVETIETPVGKFGYGQVEVKKEEEKPTIKPSKKNKK